ncbi:MAG: hypothetical protein K6B14_00690 [Lachnospiraceae bacterium]|nr:hypothetical protein [Lachnospiraceae bacterium]
MGLDLLYEHDRERIAGYQSRIDELLSREEEIIDDIREADDRELDMLLINIRTHKARGQRLLEQIKTDSRELEGEYLTATAIYQTTVETILARYEKLETMTGDAAVAYDTADAAGDAAKRIEALRSFAKKLKENSV